MTRRIAMAAAVLAISPGCATIAPVADKVLGEPQLGYSYRAGRAVQVFALPTATVEPAVLAAMDDLRIAAVRKTYDGGVLRVEGTTPDRRTATVLVRPQQAMTRVVVQVGWLGDEPLSRALMDRLGIRLGTRAPAPIPADPTAAEPQADPSPHFSREAVPDAVMLRDMEPGYRDSPVP